MITIILADSTEELEKVRHYLIPKDEDKEWLSAEEFTDLLKSKGFKAGTNISRRKYAEKFNIPTERRGNSMVYRNINIPGRK